MFDLEKTVNKFKKEIFDDLRLEKNNKYYSYEASYALFYLDKLLDEYFASFVLEDVSSDYIIIGKEI